MEVLSVVAVQVKSVLDAIRNKKTLFNFMGEQIPLISTVGLFITMNPGYAGRTELPENLKAQFRYVYLLTIHFKKVLFIFWEPPKHYSYLVLRLVLPLVTLGNRLFKKYKHFLKFLFIFTQKNESPFDIRLNFLDLLQNWNLFQKMIILIC